MRAKLSFFSIRILRSGELLVQIIGAYKTPSTVDPDTGHRVDAATVSSLRYHHSELAFIDTDSRHISSQYLADLI